MEKGQSKLMRSLVRYLLVVMALLLVSAGALAQEGEVSASPDSISEARNSGDLPELLRLLLQRAEGYRAEGYLRSARSDLTEAVELSARLNSPALRALSVSALGQLYATPVGNAMLTGDWLDPTSFFKEGMSLASESKDAAVIALVGTRLGQWHLQNGRFVQSERNYQQSIEMAESAGLKTLALIGLARAHSALSEYDASQRILEQALETAKSLAPNDRAASNLSVIEVASELSDGTQIWADALQNNDAIIGQLSQRLLASHYGEMGRWFEQKNETDAALDYTELAIKTVPDAHELAFDWEWRIGRLFDKQNDPLAAINAYRRSARHIESIRQDIPVTYREGRSSFRETIAPVFLRLADLLMQQADRESAHEKVQALLIESQNIVERFKSSELQDYFRNVCLINQTPLLNDNTLSGTAVLYPILLPERLALLIKLQSGYFHVSVPIPSARIDQIVDSLADELVFPSGRYGYQADAQQIYNWLIQPIEQLLQEANVNTLFFVPDGALRRVPLAVLWDGENHLVEKYSIASAPGLTLLNAEPFSALQPDTLLAGVSNPGAALGRLDEATVEYFVGYSRKRSRGLSTLRESVTQPKKIAAGTDARLEAFRLPAVRDEIEALTDLVPSTVLLDESFTLNRFRGEITDGDYRVVHVASHGYFGGSAKDSWLMTHDELLDMNELSRLLKPKEFANEPIELLILSACQTAEGNDLAPLGLSGVALASGARSVLGTLWVVADEATSELMKTFYAELRNPDNSKAQALRRAQIATLSIEKYSHPSYWAPFVLIGSWL